MFIRFYGKQYFLLGRNVSNSKSIRLNLEVKKYLTKNNIFSLAEIFSLKSVFDKDFILHFKFILF